jgi:hypothetical protein
MTSQDLLTHNVLVGGFTPFHSQLVKIIIIDDHPVLRGGLCALCLQITDPEDPPLRPERHIPNSTATVRRRIIDALVSRLPRCPCCRASTARPVRMNL